LRAAGERFVLRLDISDVRLIGFQRAAAAAWALPPAECEAAFAQLGRAAPIRDERGERLRYLPADLARARGYVALAALAETVAIPVDLTRLYHASAAVDPVAQHDLPTELVTPAPSQTVPKALVRNAQPNAIVIWCGDENVRAAALVVHALADFGMPILVVADDTLPGAERVASFVPLADGAAALQRARIVIPVDNDSPSDALALAQLGIPMIAPWASGACQEYLFHVPRYRAWIERDILPAARAALAAPPPRIAALPAALPDFDELPTRGPRVAVRTRIVFGTPPLRITSDTIAQQTYSDMQREGETDDARYELAVPNGAQLFPDALARLVAAAERSGAARTFGAALTSMHGDAPAVDQDALILLRRDPSVVPSARVTQALGVLRA